MSPAVEDFLSPSSSSTQRSYFQNPNPSVQKHPIDSGTFDNSFNPTNFSKLDFDCSNDAAATVRSSRRKHVKVKNHSSSVSSKPVNSTGNSIDFMFNASNSGSILYSSLGQRGSGGYGEQQGSGEFLDLNMFRFTMGATNKSKLAKNMGSEDSHHSGNNLQSGNINFAFGADEKADTRQVSDRVANKFGKLNDLDFVFGANTDNGVINSNSSNSGHEYGPDGVALHVDESESGGTVGASGIDGFLKVNNVSNESDSLLVNSLSGLNLGTEENNTSDNRKSVNLDFEFSANHRDIQTDSNYQKEESKEKVNKLVSDEKGEKKLDANLVFGTSGNSGTTTEDSGKEDFRMSSTEINSGDSVNRNVDNGTMFWDSKVTGVFHIGNQNEKRSSFKGRRKFNNQMNNLRSKGAGSCDYLKEQDNIKDSVNDGNYSSIFGSNLDNDFTDRPQSKVFNDTKMSNIHDPTKVNTTNNDSCSYSNNLFVFGSDERNMPCARSDDTSLNQCKAAQKTNEVNNVSAFAEMGNSDTVIKKQNQPVNQNEKNSDGAEITNHFSFLNKVGAFGTSFAGFNTPDINLASLFTSDMFPGLGKKLEFSNSNSVSQRKLKKNKAKLRQQGRNCLSKEEVPQSFEESSGCSPMDFSPYGGADCASTSTDPATSEVKNEVAVDVSSSTATSFADADVSARRRPHQKKYKMKTGHGLEFKTPKCRVEVSHDTEASDQEICDKWRERGNQAYKNGDLSEAEVCYSKGISSIQHTVTPGVCIEPLLLCYSNRAAARMALGRMREGLKDCKMAAKLDPNFVKVNLRSANCHLLLGELEDASHNYNKCLESENFVCLDRRMAIEAADGLQKAQKVANYLKQSAVLLQQKTYESATNALGIIADALSISCYSEKLLNMKGEALLVLGKHKEVVKLCEQTLDSAEKNFATESLKLWRWNLMSKSYFHLGRLEIALDLIEKQEQLRPTTDKSVDPESLIPLAVTIRELLYCKNAGNEAFQIGKHTEAIEHYTAAISKCTNSHSFAAVCFCNRAAAHQSLGEIIDAIGDCSTAIALDCNYQKALSRRSTLWEMIRDYKHAADDLQRLISILEKSGDNSQKSNGSVKDLRRAHRRLSSIEEKSKKERSLDFYLILGIKASDAAAEVKKAYRKAALKHHPDKAGQVLAKAESGSDGQKWKLITESIRMDADKLFKMIGEAYAVLSDSTKRSKYDLEEEMWDDMNIHVSSSSRRASDFYSSPYETNNRRNSHDSRKTYSHSHYYYGEDSRKNYHSSYPRW